MSKHKISDKTIVPPPSGVITRAPLAAVGAVVGIGVGVGIVPPLAGAPALALAVAAVAAGVAPVPPGSVVVAGAAPVTYASVVRTRILQNTNLIPDLAGIVLSYAAFIGVERLSLQGHSSGVWCVAVLPDGRVCSGSGDKSIKIWNREGRCLQTMQGSVYLYFFFVQKQEYIFVTLLQCFFASVYLMMQNVDYYYLY